MNKTIFLDRDFTINEDVANLYICNMDYEKNDGNQTAGNFIV